MSEKTQPLRIMPERHSLDAWRGIQKLLRCPVTGQELTTGVSLEELCSTDGSKRYKVLNGIPRLFCANDGVPDTADVTDRVKAFYEDTPFPNYDDLDSRARLTEKTNQGYFAKLLDAQLPRPAVILEAGCGTGQLSNFLGMGWNRVVIAGDMCVNSLTLAKSFRDKFSINNAHFLQMNLFRPPFADNTFDVIISNGVLHHTSDPFGGFLALTRKLKPGGTILIGLYNSLGRLPTLWRRRLIERFGDGWASLDSRLRGKSLNAGRHQAWFTDQYKHPHESKHSIDEVLDWFAKTGIEPLCSVPMVGRFGLDSETMLFEPHEFGSRLDRWTTEFNMLLEGGADGGLFIMIGQKKG